MAEQISYNEWLCVDGYDISGVSQNFGIERSVDLKECITFPDPTDTTTTTPFKRRHVGPESGKASIAGYLDPLINLPAFTAALGASPIITWGSARALGSSVLMFVGKEGKFSYGGPVGDIIPITAEMMNDGAVVSGIEYEFGSKTTTTTGTSQTTTAVVAGKARYLHVHVVAVTGTTPTLTVIYETSAIGDYTDAVTRHTFTQFTPSYLVERAVKTTTVSDTHGRFKWTIGGTGGPAFLVRMSEGVR